MARPPLAWSFLLPLALTSGEAPARGLGSHVHFAQMLLWAVPLADRRLRRALRALPRLALAGACLPELSLVSRYLGVPGFEVSHHWPTATRMLACAGDDAGLAAAAGYLSHLVTDTVAHNHFVPVHETLWPKVPRLTHALAEWALDHHLRQEICAAPAQLLGGAATTLAPLVAATFGCPPQAAERAMRRLARAEAALRASRVPAGALAVAGRLDRATRRRFEHFVAATALRLRDIERSSSGAAGARSAEGTRKRSLRAVPWNEGPHADIAHFVLPHSELRRFVECGR